MKPTPEWNKAALLDSLFFAPLHPVIRTIERDGFPTLNDCNMLLAGQQPVIVTSSGQAVSFVPQEYGKLPFADQYEPRCYLKGEVPTRNDNWHDLLNALVWLTFPKSKAAINARLYQALTGGGIESGTSQRGVVRDTNTLFDESGVIVACAEAGLEELLRDFQWKTLFWQNRERAKSGMGFYLFGHGLYEKTLNPYIGLTGQGLVLPVQPAFFEWPQPRQLAHLDQVLADYLGTESHCRSTRELTPVPLLGVPGWAPENACEAFYENTAYFRPGRHRRAAPTPLMTAPSSVAG